VGHRPLYLDYPGGADAYKRPRPFPDRAGRLKCLYLAVMSLDPTGRGRKRWTNRWKAALNAFNITFDGRLSAGAQVTIEKEVTPLSS
jgi:hypothetical protein